MILMLVRPMAAPTHEMAAVFFSRWASFAEIIQLFSFLFARYIQARV